MTWESEIENIKTLRKLAIEQGGQDNVDRQHAKGRLTVRERIEGLLDPGTFQEVGLRDSVR